MAGDVAHSVVPSGRVEDNVKEVGEGVGAAGWDSCTVVNGERVGLGRLGRRGIAADTDEPVERAMTPGPSTVRPSIGADALLERIRERNLSSYLVTTPDGRLVGLVLHRDLE